MKFEKRHLVLMDNVLKTLKRCQIPEITGEEMLGFTQSFSFLLEVRVHIDQIIKQEEAVKAMKASAAAIPSSNSNDQISSEVPKAAIIEDKVKPKKRSKKDK